MGGSTRLLLDLIDEAFDHKAWHGTTLLGSLRGMTAEAASWRPAPKRRNIWEVAVHAAYWKYAVRRRLTGEKRGTFALEGSNWFVRPTARSGVSPDAAWAADVRLLVDEHQRLRAAVAALSARDFDASRGGKAASKGFLVRGIAAHDLYHAGQIQLLKRLRKG